MADNTVTLVFAGDASRLDKSFQRVGVGAAGMQKNIGKMAGAFNAFNVAALAAAKMVFQFGKDSIREFAEAEKSQTKLQDAFARFPMLADTNIGRLRDLNTALAQKTRFDDDAFASGQAVLAQFQLSGKQIGDLTPLLADYAAKTGKDLPTAAETLGKSFLGNTRALKELGINYKMTGDKAKDIAAITQLVRDKVGGFAEKEGATAAGKAAILDNRFGELKETLGGKLLPVLMKATDIGIKVVGWLEKNSDIMGPLVGVIAAVVAVQWAWNIAMAANPIGLIIIGIAALIAAIVWVATKTTFFQDTWNRAWKGAKIAATLLWDWLKALPPRIGSVFAAIGRFITAPFRAAFNLISDAWNATIGRLSWTVPNWVPFIGGNTISVPQMRRFHGGGVVPGAPGSEMMAILQAGERVTPAGTGSGRLVLELRSSGTAVDDLLLLILRRAIKARGGNVQVVIGR